MTDLLQYWFNQIRFIRRMTGGTRQFTIFNFQSLFSFSSLTEACDEWAEQTYKQFLLSFFSNKFKLKRWNYGAVNLEFRTLDHPLRPPSLSQIPSKLQLIVQSAHRHSFWKRNETATTTKKKIIPIRFVLTLKSKRWMRHFSWNSKRHCEFTRADWLDLYGSTSLANTRTACKKKVVSFLYYCLFLSIFIYFFENKDTEINDRGEEGWKGEGTAAKENM